MKNLATLIRYKKWNLDERRRELAEFERLEANLRDELDGLADALRAEQHAAQTSFEGQTAYADYARASLERRRRIEESITSVASQITAAREEVAAAFEEVKRYELTRANRERDVKAHAERREQAELDEVALTRHQRQRRDSE